MTLTGGNLSLVAYTGSFGWYYFQDLPGEETYTLRASARRFEIPPETFLSLYLIGDRSDLDFVALPGYELRPSGK